jgi:ABC-type lipoprotein export system ATPase subunit
MGGAMIEFKGVSKWYSNRFVKTFVLRDLDLSIAEGEFVSIMGPSGSGKSTAMHIMGMLDSPSRGEYFFEDQPVHKLKERQRTELHRDTIGFVFQSYHLIDELTVYENLETPLIYKKLKGPDRKQKVEAVMERFGLTERRDMFPNQLSGGHQQLVGVARSVVIDPKLILADEPTGNLNSEQGTEVMGLLKKLNEEGTTIVQVTHSEQNARYASRIIHLLDGEIEKEETD